MSNDKTRVQPPRGTRDLFEEDLKKIEFVISVISRVARSYGFTRVDTPVLEHLDVFSLTSPVDLEKCYIFQDKSGRDLILRPDINTPLSRVVVNNFLSTPLPIKLFFVDKVFRYRHSSKREFRMLGLENFGVSGPQADAEIVKLTADILEEIGFSEYEVEYNNLQIYHKYLKESLTSHGLSIDSSKLLYDLRFAKSLEGKLSLLSSCGLSKGEIDLFAEMICQEKDSDSYSVLEKVASHSDVLGEELAATKEFRDSLAAYGLRGLRLNLGNLHGTGFYSGLAYRIRLDGISQEIADGGRYDNFVECLSGKQLPATGLGLGIERLIKLAESQNIRLAEKTGENGILIASDEQAMIAIIPLLKSLRSHGQPVEIDLSRQKRSHSIRYGRFKGYKYAVFIASHAVHSQALTLDIVRLTGEECSEKIKVENVKQLFASLKKILS